MTRMPDAVEMDVVAGPGAEGAPEGDWRSRPRDYVTPARP